MKDIIEKIEIKRPENRRGKTIDLETSVEVLLDYTFSLKSLTITPEDYDNITFEIKPKSFLFDNISSEQLIGILETQNVKKNENFAEIYEKFFSRSAYERAKEQNVWFTKFFKVQLKKNNENTVSEFSKYNPSDFFSATKQSVKKSILDLFKTPQNNLRVFLNSKIMKEASDSEQFEKILARLFLKNTQENIEFISDILSDILLDSQLISTIKAFQLLYYGTGLDLETFIKYLEENHSNLSVKDDMYDVIIKDINIHLKDPFFKIQENDSMLHIATENIIRFLLSIAFRDCSILISLHFLNKKNSKNLSEFLLKNDFRQFETKLSTEDIFYKVGLIDFQMKSFTHVYKYIENFKNLICLYWEYVNNLQKN